MKCGVPGGTGETLAAAEPSCPAGAAAPSPGVCAGPGVSPPVLGYVCPPPGGPVGTGAGTEAGLAPDLGAGTEGTLTCRPGPRAAQASQQGGPSQAPPKGQGELQEARRRPPWGRRRGGAESDGDFPST